MMQQIEKVEDEMERDKVYLYSMSPLLGYITFENKT